MKYTQTKLETTQGHNLFYNKEYLLPYTDDLLSFISDKAYMKTFNFALDSMMPLKLWPIIILKVLQVI